MMKQLSLTMVASLLCAPSLFAQLVTYEPGNNLIDTTDFNSVDADFWWFANFDTASLETGQPVDQNAVDKLPSWALLDNNFDPDPSTSNYSWAQSLVLGTLVNKTSSTGGNSGFDTLTLPDGTTGLSGQAIDVSEAGNGGQSNNILENLELGNDVPSSFRLWVVVDNEDTATETGVRRVKARLQTVGGEIEADTTNTIDDTRNNIADAYSFLYEGVTAGDILRIQLRNSLLSVADGTGMAGFMIQVIPEPSAAMLIALGAIGMGGLTQRRRRN